MLFKAAKFFSETVVTERTFEGYAASYGNVDSDNDVIEHGAFSKSIKEAFPKKRIKVLWQHSEPIGIPTEMWEDNKGLYVKAKISKTRLGDEAIELMKDGVIDRMSVGFIIPKDKYDYDEKQIRHIREGKLMEFSLVTFPANERAVITGMKTLKEIADYANSKDLSQFARKELLSEINSIKALLEGNEPFKYTHEPEQPLVSEISEIEKAFKETFGALALSLKK